ncbi:hypothetical protein CR513_27839, partial [Mucuna pruriens]
MDDLKVAGEWEEELRRQLVVVKAIVEKPRGVAAPSPAPSTQAFWAQPFNEEIDETTIPPNFRKVAIPRDPTRCSHELASHTPASIHKILQRPRNIFRLPVHGKQDEMLGSSRPLRHPIEQGKTSQKLPSPAFQKGLRASQFNDSLALRKPVSMEEIRTRVEKHIEVEKDKADWLEAERQLNTHDTQPAPQSGHRGEIKYQPKLKDYPLTLTPPA